MRVKLLVTGKMGSGKSFGAAYLEREHGASRWSRTELMKRLAHAIVDHIGEPDELLDRLFPDAGERADVRRALLDYALRYEPEPRKPRRLYQDVAQICQEHDPLCFERELEERIRAYGDGDFLLIDDVRSRPAFDYFTERGYRSLRLEAPWEVRRRRIMERDGYLPSPYSLEHRSETELDQVDHDFTITNDGDDPTAYYVQLDELVRRLRAAE